MLQMSSIAYVKNCTFGACLCNIIAVVVSSVACCGQVCQTGEVFFGGECEPCPEGGICDGSATITCAVGSYQTNYADSTRPWCEPCPAGGDCSSGFFVKRHPGSRWERTVVDQINVFRVIECPPGRALTRLEGNPPGDDCVLCTEGFYNIDGSRWMASNQTQSGIRPPPDGFCRRCAAGADCPGGSAVVAQEGWFMLQVGDLRRDELNVSLYMSTTLFVYKCPIDACSGNNTCNGGREGLLCGYCPDGFALELNACRECQGTQGIPTGKVVCAVLVAAIVLMILFLLGWRHAWPDNPVHNGYDTVVRLVAGWANPYLIWEEFEPNGLSPDHQVKNKALAQALQKGVPRIVDGVPRIFFTQKDFQEFKVSALSANSYIQVEQVDNLVPLLLTYPDQPTFFRPSALRRPIYWLLRPLSFIIERMNQKSWTHAIQEAKIYFSHFQVIGSFLGFRVLFPRFLKWNIHFFSIVSYVLTLDVFRWPNLGCTFMLEHNVELVVRTLLPLAMVILMVVPVVASWVWDINLHKTLDAFWHNLLTWLFLVYPSMSFTSMQAFSCRQIGDKWYLTADLRLACPTPHDFSFQYSVVSTTVWAFGTPLFIILSLWYHRVPLLAARKEKNALFNVLFDRFLEETSSSRRKGLPGVMDSPRNERSDCKKRCQKESVRIMEEKRAGCFDFTGTENVETLSLTQLLVLRDHPFERRGQQETDLDDDVGHEGLNIVNENIAHGVADRAEQTFEGKKEPGPLEEEVVIVIRKCKVLYEELEIESLDPAVSSRARTLFQKYAKCLQMRNQWPYKQGFGNSSYPFNANDFKHVAELLVASKEYLGRRLRDCDSNDKHLREITSTGRHDEASDACSLLLEITQWEERLRQVVCGQVEQKGNNMLSEGVISVPPLKWDGALGEEEKRMLIRMGFVVDAFRVKAWYWEVVDMTRKLILTSLLVVAFDGSTSHLAGSLLTSFIFLLLHFNMHPYLHRGLSNFQQIAMATHVLSISAGILYHQVDCLNALHDVRPSNEANAASTVSELLIIAINYFVVLVYPLMSAFDCGFVIQSLERVSKKVCTCFSFNAADREEHDDVFHKYIRGAKQFLQNQDGAQNGQRVANLAPASLVVNSNRNDVELLQIACIPNTAHLEREKENSAIWRPQSRTAPSAPSPWQPSLLHAPSSPPPAAPAPQRLRARSVPALAASASSEALPPPLPSVEENEMERMQEALQLLYEQKVAICM